MTTSYTLVIDGQLYSKSNRRMLVMRGHPRLLKSAKALEYERNALEQIGALWDRLPLEGDLCMTAHIYYSSRRPDLDDSLLCDVLQKGGVIGNDRQIVEKHLYKHLDKEHPRVHVELKFKWDDSDVPLWDDVGIPLNHNGLA